MPVLGRLLRKVGLTAFACVLGASAAVAGPDVTEPTSRDRAAPVTLSLPTRVMVWPSLSQLTFWWHGAQAAAGQPAQPTQPAPAQPAPAQPAPAQPAPAPAPTPASPEPAPAQPAPAQPAPAPEAQPAPAPAEPAGEAAPTDADVIAQAEAELEGADAEGEVIVVTGSAIERKETTTPAPVSVVDREELNASGMVSVGDILQNLPAQANGINIQQNNGGDGSTRIDLRGLGADRTLVLINGRRHVPGGVDRNASVDLNALPLAIIKRVEVLKDGASAIYGSDALGGVVNIITRDDFDGTEANVYTGTTQRGDGTAVDVSFVTGQASRRGNVVFSGGYVDQQPVFAGDRDFAEVSYAYNFADGIRTTDGSTTTPNGYVKVGADVEAGLLCPGQAGVGCTPDSQSQTGFRNFDDSGASDRNEGDLYNFQPENYLATPSRRYNVFSSGNYKFHQNVRGFVEASFINRKSAQRLAPEPLSTGVEGVPVSADSIYNPTDIDLPAVQRRMLEAGPRTNSQSVNTFRVVTGLDGTVPDRFLEGWKWEASFNYGRTENTAVKTGNFVRDRVAQAIGPSYFDPVTGEPRCGTLENPGDPACVPLNLLGGENTVTPEMLDYLTYTGTANAFVQQRTFLGLVNGPLFKTPWGGDVVLAVGGDYRQEEGGQQADPLTASGNTTGNKSEPTKGKYDVIEGFAELSIVPVTNQDWAKWLEFNFAAREVSYSSFGEAFTWKAGGLYRLPMGLAFRGTYSTAFRAPSIGELFSGEGDSFQSATDPCDTNQGMEPVTDPILLENCTRELGRNPNGPDTSDPNDDFTDTRTQMPTRVGGNPDLDAETAKVWTTGIVYEPPFLEGLGISVDYFNVKIRDAIQQATASVLLGNCYTLENESDCEKIIRSETTGEIIEMRDLERNIGGNDTDGIDFNVNYEHSYPDIGRFRHNLEGTWLNEFTNSYPSRVVEGVGVYDLGVYPRWKFNFTTIWGLRGVGLGFNTRYIHGYRECTAANNCNQEGVAMLDHDVDANITADVFASYAVTSPAGTTSLTVGVNNIADQEPPLIYNGFLANSDSFTYDLLGRFFYARLTQAF
jgi:iron complex outermembrane recepter protein